MAESCIDMYRCGTRYPGWLNGSLPTVNEGVVQRIVCFRYFSDCCSFSTYIRVRNCGGFYVYQLKPLTYCNLRYCGNGYGSSTPTPGTLFFFLSFFFFFHPVKNALGIYRWNKYGHSANLPMVKMSAIFSSILPSLLPTNQPSNGRILSQPLTTTVWLKYWFSVVKILSEPKIFNLHI